MKTVTAEKFGVALGNMIIAIALAILISLEFDYSWKMMAVFYVLVFNFLRVVDGVVNRD